MPKITLTKHYDHYVPGGKMTSYDPGDYDVSETVAEQMRTAGVIEGSGPAPKGGDAVVDVPGKAK